MKTAWPASLALLAMTACGEGYDLFGRPCGVPYEVCTDSARVVVDDGIVDFESACDDARCKFEVIHGGADIGPSFHPADHALRIGPDSTVDVSFSMAGSPLADGASLSLNAHCAEGGRLRFLGDQKTLIPTGDTLLTDTGTWGRHERSIRTATRLINSLPSGPSTGRLDVTLHFRNEGTATCSIDRLVYRTSALVCVQRETRINECPKR